MQVALSDLKVNVEKYVELADVEDIIITKSGKPTAKIVSFDHAAWRERIIPEKVTDISQLFGTLPDDISLDDVRMERLSNRKASLFL
ncbi:MAG: type II toxin-antitoxin system prevent-host-death family antitoxin [Oscillospiraceae bacterium]|jgi:prevent-host-death family protein|nr:type II toxin-antitoxin system prevent-host-death family antitoxin [Oscillospiraceae bacterium]